MSLAGTSVYRMATETLLRLTAERLRTAIADIDTPQAADLRAELADPTRVRLGAVAEVSGLSGVPVTAFFGDAA